MSTHDTQAVKLFYRHDRTLTRDVTTNNEINTTFLPSASNSHISPAYFSLYKMHLVNYVIILFAIILYGRITILNKVFAFLHKQLNEQNKGQSFKTTYNVDQTVAML